LEDLSAKVVSISRSLTPELEALAKSHRDRLRLVLASVTDQAGVSKAVADTLSEFGQLDGLILNAGTLDPLGRIENESISLDAWKTHFDVNFFSLIGIVRAALPALRESRGRVVFVSSGAAISGTAGWGPYNASKAAMNSLCR
jgi:NAD(P)-dependent dehydrogenase (short-subunit alcohol dehydrogenase family)